MRVTTLKLDPHAGPAGTRPQPRARGRRGIEVDITRSTLKRSVRKEATMCAIAIAAGEQYGGQWSVGGKRAIRRNGLFIPSQQYILGREGRRLIDDFDGGRTVRPQTVTLYGPPLRRRNAGGARTPVPVHARTRGRSDGEIALAVITAAAKLIVLIVRGLILLTRGAIEIGALLYDSVEAERQRRAAAVPAPVPVPAPEPVPAPRGNPVPGPSATPSPAPEPEPPVPAPRPDPAPEPVPEPVREPAPPAERAASRARDYGPGHAVPRDRARERSAPEVPDYVPDWLAEPPREPAMRVPGPGPEPAGGVS